MSAFIAWIKSLFSVVGKEPAKVIPMPQLKPEPVVNQTPWMTWMNERLGWSESKDDAKLARYWRYVGLPEWKTCIGREHAWCAMTVNAALIESGYHGNGSAAAASFIHYGTPSDDKYGAILVVQRKNGGHHVCFRGKSGLLGGNQDNKICEKAMSPDDKIVAVRWPIKA